MNHFNHADWEYPRLAIPKSRRERIVEEMAAEFPRLLDETSVVPPAPGTAEKWLTC